MRPPTWQRHNAAFPRRQCCRYILFMSLTILLIDSDEDRAAALEQKLSESSFARVLRADGPDLAAAVAKAILMKHRKMTEPEAYRWLQKKAMNESRKLSVIVAEFVAQHEPGQREAKP